MSVLVLAGGAFREAGAAERPRLDYAELAKALDGELSFPAESAGVRDRLLGPLPGNWPHALAVRRRPVSAFLSLSESEGLPLSLALAARRRARPAHTMVAHNILTRKMVAAQRVTGFLRRVDRIVVLSRAQEEHLHSAGVPPECVRFVHDKVDHRFFAPQGDAGAGGYVLSVGSEARDYPTLLDAVGRLGAPTVLVPSSLWFGDADVGALPANVTVRRKLPFHALRELYDRAAAVVVPVLPGARYAAGVNAVLEGMAMQRPLVVTDSPGLAGYLDDGETMRTVPAGDPAALAEILDGLLRDRVEADRLAARARAVVEGGRNLDGYVAAIAETVRLAQRARA